MKLKKAPDLAGANASEVELSYGHGALGNAMGAYSSVIQTLCQTANPYNCGVLSVGRYEWLVKAASYDVLL